MNDLVYKNNVLMLTNLDSFSLKDIFTCGQAFRWYVEKDGSYTAIHDGKVINLKEEYDYVRINNSNVDDFMNIWFHYFDMGTRYDVIKEKLSTDEIMSEAIKSGEGIRILKQDPFEMLISFIISANNQIPRIKNAIEKISSMYGKKIEIESDFCGAKRDFFSFPSPSELRLATVSELRDFARVGFRDVRIYEAANKIYDGEFDLDVINDMNYDDGEKLLISLNGVGSKVAGCILLFGYGKVQAFPVDVWVKRIMELLYLKEPTPNKVIKEYGMNKFGELSGYAQQYLFYYARENGLGK